MALAVPPHTSPRTQGLVQWKMWDALELFWPLYPGVPRSPQSLWALPEMGGQQGDRIGCGTQGCEGDCQESSSSPLGQALSPSRWKKDGSGCVAVEEGHEV